MWTGDGFLADIPLTNWSFWLQLFSASNKPQVLIRVATAKVLGCRRTWCLLPRCSAFQLQSSGVHPCTAGIIVSTSSHQWPAVLRSLSAAKIMFRLFNRSLMGTDATEVTPKLLGACFNRAVIPDRLISICGGLYGV